MTILSPNVHPSASTELPQPHARLCSTDTSAHLSAFLLPSWADPTVITANHHPVACSFQPYSKHLSLLSTPSLCHLQHLSHITLWSSTYIRCQRFQVVLSEPRLGTGHCLHSSAPLSHDSTRTIWLKHPKDSGQASNPTPSTCI